MFGSAAPVFGASMMPRRNGRRSHPPPMKLSAAYGSFSKLRYKDISLFVSITIVSTPLPLCPPLVRLGG